ncbi:hypothetical protein Tco_1460404, partial [Tanacetum coccineum]
DGYKVQLHVYDLSNVLSRQLSMSDLGEALEAKWYSPLSSLLCYHTSFLRIMISLEYSIDHQEDLNQQKMNDEFKIELRNELLNTMQSLCEMIFQREQAANVSTHTHEPSRLERIFKKKAKNDQTKHGIEKTKSIQSQSQSKVSRMKKIQLEGLKLPNLKLYYKRKRQGSRNCKPGEVCYKK